jgi:transposase-like protein
MNKKTEKKHYLREQRKFSEGIKKQTVRDIETGKCSVLEASRELTVSIQSVYRWVHLYSRYLTKNKIMVVEEKSEGYRSKELERRLHEMEAALGRKQMEIDFLNKIIDLANEEYRTDLKKNIAKEPLGGSRRTKGKNTDTT